MSCVTKFLAVEKPYKTGNKRDFQTYVSDEYTYSQSWQTMFPFDNTQKKFVLWPAKKNQERWHNPDRRPIFLKERLRGLVVSNSRATSRLFVNPLDSSTNWSVPGNAGHLIQQRSQDISQQCAELSPSPSIPWWPDWCEEGHGVYSYVYASPSHLLYEPGHTPPQADAG